MELEGLYAGDLFGFMATLGTLALLDADSRAHGRPGPRLSFSGGCMAVVTGGPSSHEAFVSAVFDALQSVRPLYEGGLADVAMPADFTQTSFAALASAADRTFADVLSGLACVVGDDVHESTLCAANGAGHQKLIQSMRDVLMLVNAAQIEAALFHPWVHDFEPTTEQRRALALGNRKPTLRLDPGDERLYALRASNPVGSDARYRTELGAQALAVSAFSLLPVLPRRRPVCVSSRRERRRVFFEWFLWSDPCSLRTVRSLLAIGPRHAKELRARGAFAAFRCARINGDKGKLSLAPTEGVW